MEFCSSDGTKFDKIIIYGAQTIAESVIKWIREFYQEIKIIGIAVNKIENNPKYVCEIQVKTIDEYQEYTAIPILISCGRQFHEDIKSDLQKKGFKQIYCINGFDLNTILKYIINDELRKNLKGETIYANNRKIKEIE